MCVVLLPCIGRADDRSATANDRALERALDTYYAEPDLSRRRQGYSGEIVAFVYMSTPTTSKRSISTRLISLLLAADRKHTDAILLAAVDDTVERLPALRLMLCGLYAQLPRSSFATLRYGGTGLEAEHARRALALCVGSSFTARAFAALAGEGHSVDDYLTPTAEEIEKFTTSLDEVPGEIATRVDRFMYRYAWMTAADDDSLIDLLFDKLEEHVRRTNLLEALDAIDALPKRGSFGTQACAVYWNLARFTPVAVRFRKNEQTKLALYGCIGDSYGDVEFEAMTGCNQKAMSDAAAFGIFDNLAPGCPVPSSKLPFAN